MALWFYLGEYYAICHLNSIAAQARIVICHPNSARLGSQGVEAAPVQEEDVEAVE